jgi:hypothetical protein
MINRISFFFILFFSLSSVFASLPYHTSQANKIVNPIITIKLRDYNKNDLSKLQRDITSIPSSVNTLILNVDEDLLADRNVDHAIAMLPNHVKHINFLRVSASSEFAKVLATLPKTVKTITFSLSQQYEDTSNQIMEVLQAIPSTVEYLYIDIQIVAVSSVNDYVIEPLKHVAGDVKHISINTGIYKSMSIEIMQNYFKSLNPSLSSLYIYGFPSYEKIDASLFTLGLLPQTITYLNMSDFFIAGFLDVNDAASIFMQLPNSLTTLVLENNQLNYYGYDEIPLIFKALSHTNIKNLNLKSNGLFIDNPESEMEVTLNFLPNDFDSIDITNNGMGAYTVTEIQHFASYLSSRASEIILDEGGVVDDSAVKHVAFFKSLTPKTISIGFGANNSVIFSEFTDYLKVIQSFPKFIKKISLKNTRLGTSFSFEQLKSIFSALPQNLQSLDLRNTELSHLTQEQLSELLKVLPLSLQEINVARNELEIRFTSEELESIFSVLPSNGKTIIISELEFEGINS